MIRANPIDTHAHESLYVGRAVQRPGDDLRAEIVDRADEIFVQHLALLPQRLGAGILECPPGIARLDVGQDAARQVRPLLGEPADDVKSEAVNGVSLGIRTAVQCLEETIVPARIEDFYLDEHLEPLDELHDLLTIEIARELIELALIRLSVPPAFALVVAAFETPDIGPVGGR